MITYCLYLLFALLRLSWVYNSLQTIHSALTFLFFSASAAGVRHSLYWFIPFASHFSSLHLGWFPPPLPPSTASCKQDSCENSEESLQPAEKTSSLLSPPILTRFSRDIRGNKRCDIPPFKAPPDNFDARFILNKWRRGWGCGERILDAFLTFKVRWHLTTP